MYHLPSKKIISAFVFLFLFLGQSFAQDNIEKHDTRNENRKYSYGVHLGLGLHNFRAERSNQFLQQEDFYAIEGVNNYSAEIGIIGILHPIKNVELRFIPAITFGNRDVNFYPVEYDDEESVELIKLETTALDLPLYVKYKSEPYKDMRMFALAGGKYRRNLSYKDAPDNLEDATLRLTEADSLVELGFGAEIHFDLFTLAPEFKVSQGFMNQRALDNTVYVDNLSALYSRVYSIGINIE